MTPETEVQRRSSLRQEELLRFYQSGSEEIAKRRIPLEDCKDAGVYRLYARNLALGIFVREHRGFVGIREKFGQENLAMEYHWDTGIPFGTAHPIEFLEECSLSPIQDDNKELLTWLQAKEIQHFSHYPQTH